MGGFNVKEKVGEKDSRRGGGAEVIKTRSFHPENDYVVTSEFLIRII